MKLKQTIVGITSWTEKEEKIILY